MKIEYKFIDGSICVKDFIKTNLYCPNCSKRNVWVENCEGDYYQGPQHLCFDCKYSFTIPSGGFDYTVRVITN